jgi:hypothetical protein
MNMKQLDPPLDSLMRDLRAAVLADKPAPADMRARVCAVLEFLASPHGRTDKNCCVVDLVLMNDAEIWNHIEAVDAVDSVLAEVLRDMAGALHDTVTAPEVAQNFESTPEQLLRRLREG